MKSEERMKLYQTRSSRRTESSPLKSPPTPPFKNNLQRELDFKSLSNDDRKSNHKRNKKSEYEEAMLIQDLETKMKRTNKVSVDPRQPKQ